MAPGLLSEGGQMIADLPIGTAMAIMCEGKKHAIGIGILTMSSEEIETEKKGQAIEVITSMGDTLWQYFAPGGGYQMLN